jgi:hypothetical protein
MKTEEIKVRLTPSQKSKIKKISEKKDISASEFLRQAAKEKLERDSKKPTDTK